PDFPVLRAAQPAIRGASNAFIAKLAADGSGLAYSTYLGGTDTDGASSIAVDSAGQAYITGVTSSRTFPIVNPLRQSHGGGFFDAYVAKLNSAGTQFVYSTYLGGTSEDRGLRIAADSSGSAYIAGDTDSLDFPTGSAIQPAKKGSSDAFISKLNPTGTSIVYSTYVGGSGLDGATGIAVDSSDFAYLTGFTQSNDFLLTAPVQTARAAAFDAFVLVLDPSGRSALMSSYLGGTGIGSGVCIAADSNGGLYVMGQTSTTDLPVSNALQSAYGGGPSDVFIGRIAIGPLISDAQISGKKLLVSGIGFDDGAKVLLNGEQQKTTN